MLDFSRLRDLLRAEYEGEHVHAVEQQAHDAARETGEEAARDGVLLGEPCRFAVPPDGPRLGAQRRHRFDPRDDLRRERPGHGELLQGLAGPLPHVAAHDPDRNRDDREHAKHEERLRWGIKRRRN